MTVHRQLEILGESICPYCGVGCRLRVEGFPESPTRIRGVEDAPANLGRICAKGALLAETVHSPDRLTHPQIRSRQEESFRPTDWPAAFRTVAERLQAIRAKHGPDSVGFYGSGQLDSEAAFVACKLFKGYLGTNNTDSNSRLCMAAAVAGYRTSLGSDGPPCCYEDIDLADVILIIGSNMAEAHPVTFDRIRAAKKARPGLFVIVVDPRKTLTARDADLHTPLAPGGDIPLLNALGKQLFNRGCLHKQFINEHTRGFEEYRSFLRGLDLDQLCERAGVSREQLKTMADRISKANSWLSFYCMGLNQSIVGMWKNNSLINLHLLTGQIGKPGAGPFSLTGQPNAMGGRETGLLSHQLPGYRSVEDAGQRVEMERLWQLPQGSINQTPGLTAVEMFRALERGSLKAIWIAATNPLVSLPDLHQARRAIAKAELVIVQDAYHPTESSEWAHILLPAAQWGEKDWTSTSSERLVSFSPKLWNAPGKALPDWQILSGVARAMGLTGFDYKNSGEVWDEFCQLTASRPCDMSGITSERLRRDRHVYWPCPSVDHPGTNRRYLDHHFATPDGRAVFLPRDHRSPRELPDHEFPFILTTGRLYSHWHTLTRTAKCSKLVQREPGPYLEVNVADAGKLGVDEGEEIRISSRRGTIQLPARLSENVEPGTVFLPFHWGDLFAPGNSANYLTISATGRIAKQPELKFCAVQLEKLPLPKEAFENKTTALAARG
ncbi:MAG TPA: nitrate reductase [Gemmataceae bacterium]|nr:nitrate reductase [Gemmataceae bacterium]